VHYRCRVQACELWNEPKFSDFALHRAHPGFFTGSMNRAPVVGPKGAQ